MKPKQRTLTMQPKRFIYIQNLSDSTKCLLWVVLEGWLWVWVEALDVRPTSVHPPLAVPKSLLRLMPMALPPSAWTRPPSILWTRNSFRSWHKLSSIRRRQPRWLSTFNKGHAISIILGHRAHIWKQSVLRWSWHHGDVSTKPREAWDILGEPSGPLAGHLWLQTAYDSCNHRPQVSFHANMWM